MRLSEANRSPKLSLGKSKRLPINGNPFGPGGTVRDTREARNLRNNTAQNAETAKSIMTDVEMSKMDMSSAVKC